MEPRHRGLGGGFRPQRRGAAKFELLSFYRQREGRI
jgi:hypothetical protein